MAVEAVTVEGSVTIGQKETPRLHLKHVEGLRALAALVVFVNHAYGQVWEGSDSVGGPGGVLAPLSYSMVAGHLAVTVFIVVSGFCLTMPVVRSGDQLRGGVSGFLKRRAWRILPPYYAAVALSLLLIWTIIGEPTGTLWDVPIQVTPASIVSHLLLLQDLFGTGSINYVFWSIAVEWQMYFLFPLLILGWKRFGAVPTVAIALAAGYALRVGFDHTRIARANSHFIGMFAFGMLAAYITFSRRTSYERLRRSAVWGWSSAVALAVVSGLVVFWNVLDRQFGFPVVDFFVGVMTTSALVLSSRNENNPLTRLLSWRPLVFVGTFSYSLYLIHAPLLQVLWQYLLKPAGLGPHAMFSLLMTLGLAFVLAAAYWFFRLCEAPFMQTAGGTGRDKLVSSVPAS